MQKFAKIIEYLFYIFVFLLPWQTRWIWHYGKLGAESSQYLIFSLYGTEIILFLIFILVLVYKLKFKDEEAAILNYKVLDFYIIFILLFLVAALSLLWAHSFQTAFYYLIKFLAGFAVLLFIINFKFSLKKAGWALVLAGLFQSILASYQFLAQEVLASKWLGLAQQLPQTLGVSVIEFNGLRLMRAYGAFSHPNILGGFLAVCLVFLTILLILSQSKKQSVFLWFCLPIISAGLFFAFSKSAFLALAAGLFFLIIFVFLSSDQQAKIIFSQIVFVIFTVLAVLFLIYQQPVLARLAGEGRLEQKSFTERALYLDQAKELIKNNWLQGAGLGNYVLALYDQDEKKQPAWAYQPVHNVYLLSAAELGIFGFLFFILIIIEAFRRLWSVKIEERAGLLKAFALFKLTGIFDFYRRNYFWHLGLTAVFIMILVLMAFDHYFWTQYFGIMFWWLMLGLWLKQVALVR
ncbi:MAG TPA: O-antigen ligase family protein [Candidatus Uhrbacteria bacterium]|nr:O-antigen ligase family protein [Candidatus Uhrbacteria bacterium]